MNTRRLDLNRRDFLAATGATAAGLALGGVARAGSERPNVLLVLVDQWRMPRWFPAGAELPGFDRLRREGPLRRQRPVALDDLLRESFDVHDQDTAEELLPPGVHQSLLECLALFVA